MNLHEFIKPLDKDALTELGSFLRDQRRAAEAGRIWPPTAKRIAGYQH